MSYDTPFACMTIDTGFASELVHVSPIFVRCGPRARGRYAEARLARARRTDARRERFAAPPVAAAATEQGSNRPAAALVRYSDANRGDTLDLQNPNTPDPRA